MNVGIVCGQCGAYCQMETSAVNKAARSGYRLFCGRTCSGLARRKHRTDDEKKQLKADYDRKRRDGLAEQIRQLKRAYHKRTYDPIRAAIERKEKMPRHVEYCRRPEYRAYKRNYDKQHLAKKEYGEFWEAALLVGDLTTEVLSRATKYEIYLESGRLNKCLQRRREHDQTIRR